MCQGEREKGEDRNILCVKCISEVYVFHILKNIQYICVPCLERNLNAFSL